jgi:glycolate dehydrogenase FAD-linked subunit
MSTKGRSHTDPNCGRMERVRRSFEVPMARIAFPPLDDGVLFRRDSILDGLAKFLPSECLIADESGRLAFETDALTAYRRLPLAVALPRSAEEVARVLRFCRDEKVNVVPRGAGTSLSGGAIPQEDAIVLALTKMNRILEVNLADRYARVEAGVTNLAISDAVGPEGFFYAPDPSSQLACTIGGNIAMNSGGAHCLKYGVTTNNLLGVRFVTFDGEILDVGGPATDAAGYDLLGLICGSEGQLGVVTEATVRLLRSAEGARPVLFGFASVEDASRCVAAIIGAGIVPVAMEYMDRPAINICEDFAHAGYPRDAEAMLIIEVEGSESEMQALLARISAIARAHDVRTVRESMSAMETAQIWKGRKSAFGATGRVADYICMDGTVPTGRLPEALRRTGEICASYGLRVANVFHAGDGNMHPLILYNVNDPAEAAKAEAAGADILSMCVELGGCLTGEHGVGIEKRDLMPRQFSPPELAQQKRVRAVFDPDGRLNPAKVFPLAEGAG